MPGCRSISGIFIIPLPWNATTTRNTLTDVSNWKQGDPQQLTEQAVEQIHGWNLQRNFACSETEIFGLLKEELDNYYQYDLATAEETAKSIQTKMNIFLNE